MASSLNTLDQLDGLFKNVYAKNVEKLVPEANKLVKEIPFVERSAQPGSYFNQPVNLQVEHGFTYGGEDGGAFALNAAVASTTKNAQVRGVEIVLRGMIPANAITRSENVPEGAFVAATKYVVENLMESFYRKLEIDLFYGQKGLGTVTSVSGLTLTLDTRDWASGIWTGAKNMPINIRSADGATNYGDVTVTGVDIDNRQLTIDATPLGGAPTAGSIIWHKGSYDKQFAGMEKIISNTGSLFGINAADYELWKGNTQSVTGSLDFAKAKSGIAKAVAKGLQGMVQLYVNTNAWEDLLSDLASKRSYDSSYSKAKLDQGAEKIEFFSQNGKIEVIPSIFVKEGDAFLIDPKCFKRIGSKDVHFQSPNRDGKYLKMLENANGYEMRLATDQALFCHAPGRNVLVNGIVNS